jgi:CHAT domain-containing protein/tetratricopeptide (TPR) repeat protein
MAQVFLLPQDREQTPENIATVEKNLDAGEQAFQKRDFDKAISSYQEAYGLAREIKFAEGEGRALTKMCTFYHQKGQISRAKELGENAIEVLSDAGNKKALAEARIALACVYLAQDNTYYAVQQLQAAMESISDMSSTDGASASRVLMLAADLGIRNGKIKEAIQCYQAAANYCGQSGETRQQVGLLVKVSGMLIQLGLLAGAQEEAAKAVSVARDSKQPDELVVALGALANAQFCLDEYADSRKTYEELLPIKVPGQTIEQRANLVEGYAFTLAAQGDIDQAKLQLEKVLPVVKGEGLSYERALVEDCLGVLSALQGNYSVAIGRFKTALDSLAVLNPKREGLQCSVLQNLGAAESRAGQNRNAKLHYAEALAVATSKTVKNPLLEGRTYACLAESCLALKDYTDAEQAVKAGLAASQPINDDAALWRLYTCMAEVQMGNDQAAGEALSSAVSFFRSPQAGEFYDPAKLIYPTLRQERGRDLVSLLVKAGMNEQALLTAEQLKQEAFINEWLRRGGSVRPADRDIYEDMVTGRSHLHAAEEAGTSPETLLPGWREWLRRFQHVAADNPGLARLIAPVPINFSDLLKTVQNNHAVVLDYLVGERQTTVFVIDANRKLTAFNIACTREDLQHEVASLLTASAKKDETTAGNERRILQLLDKELLPEVVANCLPTTADQTVVIVPDSVLYNLPFAALIGPDEKYLVEGHTLTMIPELDMLVSARHQSKDLSLLVTGDNAGEDSEAGQIASVFDKGQVTTLAGKDAGAETLEEQAKTSSMIHLSQSMRIPQTNTLNCFVPYASKGAGQQVTANGLFDLNLPSDLAVLSSTAVSAKDFYGNGVQVFSRGLNYAGVRNVMMSLWFAPDPSRTSELVDFYRCRQQGLSQAASLRKAQLLSLSKDPTPRAWAAFQLIGPGM